LFDASINNPTQILAQETITKVAKANLKTESHIEKEGREIQKNEVHISKLK